VPWREISLMSEQLNFIIDCLDRSVPIVEICRRYGISEKTGHKRLRRFREEGIEGIHDRSRARLTHPFRIAPEVIEQILAIKRKFRSYGPKTIRHILTQRDPGVRWPVASSIGEILKRNDLVRPKRKHHSLAHSSLGTGRTRATEANTVWTADFKGQFRLGGRGEYCYPLTVMDLSTRYLLACSAFDSTAVATTEKAFVRLFQEHGLPKVIRTDNGVPFCQPNALGRLGRLAYWWVTLGIKPEHIKPATPSENGAHERFHRTLKAAAITPPSNSIGSQQRRFNSFTVEYNKHRPHTSLPDQRPPGEFYCDSNRPYPKRLPVIEYPSDWEVRLVSSSGQFKWKDRSLHLSENLAGQYVGITENDRGLLTVSFGSLELGDIEMNPIRFLPRLRWTGTI
jgi:transposase InsO family protein